MRYLLGVLCLALICVNSHQGQPPKKQDDPSPSANPLLRKAKAVARKAAARARAPEELLPADAIAFFRYDGYEPHRLAYDKTTLGELMKDDVGVFLNYLGQSARDLFVNSLNADDDDEDKPFLAEAVQAKARVDIDQFADYFWRHGFVVSVEVSAPPLEIPANLTPGRWANPAPTQPPITPIMRGINGGYYLPPIAVPDPPPSEETMPAQEEQPGNSPPPAKKPEKKDGPQHEFPPLPPPVIKDATPPAPASAEVVPETVVEHVPVGTPLAQGPPVQYTPPPPVDPVPAPKELPAQPPLPFIPPGPVQPAAPTQPPPGAFPAPPPPPVPAPAPIPVPLPGPALPPPNVVPPPPINPPETPKFAITIVFPQGGDDKNRAVVLNFLKLAGRVSHTKIGEKKEGARTIFTLADDKIAWWQEGEHIVLRLSNEPVSRAIDVAEGRRPNLTSAPLFHKVAGFKSYETDIRGCVDIDRLVNMVRKPSKNGSGLDGFLEGMMRNAVLEYLGANDVHSLTFHMGFAGKFQRSTILLHVEEPNKRAGLLKLLSSVPPKSAPLDLAGFPAMPADAVEVAALQVDWVGLHDFVVRTIGLVKLFAQRDGPSVLLALASGGKQLDEWLGFSLRDDFLASLDTTVVTFGAHSEGPFILGQALAIKVKNAAKLQDCLGKLNDRLSDAKIGFDLQKRTYRGADMYVLSPVETPLDDPDDPLAPGPAPARVVARGMVATPFAPTYAIHKDWLLTALYPQPIMGCILREGGKRKAWQPPPYYQELLDQDLKVGGPHSRLAGVAVINPVYDLEMGLAVLPVLAASLSTSTGTKFDVTKIPNAQAVNEFLYPTVGFFFDDGTTLRWENHFAIDFPTELLLPFAASAGIPSLTRGFGFVSR